MHKENTDKKKGVLTKLMDWIPAYARVRLPICLFSIITAYYLPRLLNVPERYDFSIPLDAKIPLIPAFSYVYVLGFLFWTISYIRISRQSRRMCTQLVLADTIAKTICLFTYLFFQSYTAFPEGFTGVGAWLLRIVYYTDEPNNLLPSIHCFVSYLSFRPLFDREFKGVRIGGKVIPMLIAMSVCLSTLFTKQHVFWDVPTGIAVAEIGWLLAGLLLRKKRERRESA